MAFDFDNNHTCYLYLHRKRCFVILLLLNSFLACIYYIYEQNQSHVKQIPNYFNRTQSLRKLTKPIEFLRNTLENEYNRDDLEIFYNMVEEEFSLGLRCTRKVNQPLKTTAITNSNLTSAKQIDSNITTTRYRLQHLFFFVYKIPSLDY